MNPSRYQLQHLWMLMVTMLNPSNNNLFFRLYPSVQTSEYGTPELLYNIDHIDRH
jgi:hypothetical protein